MGNFTADLDAGREFEDFVSYTLWRHGMPLRMNLSKRFQQEYGEGNLVECKLNRKMFECQTLYMETEQFSHGEWVPSGVQRQGDETIFIAAGQEKLFFLFTKSLLRAAEPGCKHTSNAAHPRDMQSKGFLLPLDLATQLAERAYVWGREELDLGSRFAVYQGPIYVCDCKVVHGSEGCPSCRKGVA